MADILKDDDIVKIRQVCAAYPELAALYFFGSRARGEAGPTSDYDFAVYVNNPDKQAIFNTTIALREALSRIFKSDAVEVVALNLVNMPEFKYNVIAHGMLVFEREPFRVLVEPRVLNEYFDFRAMLRRHGLTRA